MEGATDDFQDLLETRVAELRDDTGLTAVAVAATIDGDLARDGGRRERLHAPSICWPIPRASLPTSPTGSRTSGPRPRRSSLPNGGETRADNSPLIAPAGTVHMTNKRPGALRCDPPRRRVREWPGPADPVELAAVAHRVRRTGAGTERNRWNASL